MHSSLRLQVSYWYSDPFSCLTLRKDRLFPHLICLLLEANIETKEKCKPYFKLLLLNLLLRSHQASQQTNSGRVRDQPGLPVHEGSFI